MAVMNSANMDRSPSRELVGDPQHKDTNLTSRRWLSPLVIAALIFGVLLVTGAAYIWVSGGTGQPSSTTTAPSLSLQPDDTRTLFHIAGQESEVRFIINEELLGEPKTVVGATTQVAGDLLVDFNNPTNSELGTIQINVRTLETDNEFRNRALRGQILQSDQPEQEFASFSPVELISLPQRVVINTSIDFQIVGNLTLHGVTREVTFNASVLPESETRLEGLAQATILRNDFNLTIPEAPGVANVSEEVQLEIEFTAIAADA